MGQLSDDCADGEVLFRNSVVENTGKAGIYIRTKSSKAVKLVFENILLSNIGIENERYLGVPVTPIVLHAYTLESQVPGNIEFKNVHVKEDRPDFKGSPIVRLSATSSAWNVVWTNVIGNIISSAGGDTPVRVLSVGTENVTLSIEKESLLPDRNPLVR